MEFIRPLIGAIIGYITNWLAVKMMFRPLKPIKIGKIKIPFTPGIIPKNKERIAKSIGNAISNNLLTEDTITKSLLTEKWENTIKESIERKIKEIEDNNDITLKENVLKIVEVDSYNKVIGIVNNELTTSIKNTLKSDIVDDLVNKEIERIIEEKLKGTLFGKLGIKSIISKIANEIHDGVNKYIDENGDEIISKVISKKINDVEDTKTSDLVRKLDESEIDVVSSIISMYEKIISEKLPDIIKKVDISSIVEDKINSMDMLELEKIIFSIMKKELNALVNLGAVIGFLLGLINLVF